MSKRILSVSYDDVLLATRKMLLEQQGCDVTSALGFTDAVEQCQQTHFDLFILGHSIPEKDKLHLIKTFRENCAAPIVSLERIGEKQIPCDFHASPDDPERFLKVVNDILAKREQRSRGDVCLIKTSSASNQLVLLKGSLPQKKPLASSH